MWVSTASLIPVGLSGEYAGYRFVLGVGLACRLVTRLLLLFAEGTAAMSWAQATYGVAQAINYTALFNYVYMLVPAEHFLSATSVVHASHSAGNFIGSLLGQVLEWSGLGLQWLFVLSLGFVLLSGGFYFALPGLSTRQVQVSFANVLKVSSYVFVLWAS